MEVRAHTGDFRHCDPGGRHTNSILHPLRGAVKPRPPVAETSFATYTNISSHCTPQFKLHPCHDTKPPTSSNRICISTEFVPALRSPTASASPPNPLNRYAFYAVCCAVKTAASRAPDSPIPRTPSACAWRRAFELHLHLNGGVEGGLACRDAIGRKFGGRGGRPCSTIWLTW